MLAAEDPLSADTDRNKVANLFFFSSFIQQHDFWLMPRIGGIEFQMKSSIFLDTDFKSLWLLLYNCLHYWNCLESHRIRIGTPQRSLLSLGFQSPRFVGRLRIPNFLWIQVMPFTVSVLWTLIFVYTYSFHVLLYNFVAPELFPSSRSFEYFACWDLCVPSTELKALK